MTSPDRSAACFAALLTIAVGIPSTASSDEEATALGKSMTRFTATLDSDQSSLARYAFEDEERFDLRLAPLGLEGLPINEMTENQWSQLRAALADVLSPAGLQKIETIRSLEHEVAEMETGFFAWFMRNYRDPKRYFLALFGDPGGDEPWGLRFDGHHLSLNWTSVPGAPLSVTPLFLGGQPREVPAEYPRAGFRVLAEEEDRGVALVAALSQGQREQARLAFREGSAIRRPMFIGDGEALEESDAVGVLRSELDADAAGALDALIEVQLGNFAAPIADRTRARISRQRASIRFAYAREQAKDADRPLRAGDPFYYRIQGDDFLIEFDDTSSAADHIHVVFRERSGDFGRDLLADHYEHGHAR